MFWDPSLDEDFGAWSTDGCTTEFIGSRGVSCKCDHLSTFAVLVVSLVKILLNKYIITTMMMSSVTESRGPTFNLRDYWFHICWLSNLSDRSRYLGHHILHLSVSQKCTYQFSAILLTGDISATFQHTHPQVPS